MGRPEFPRCILPVAAIRAIVAEQKAYDNDPEEYERWEKNEIEQSQSEDEEDEHRRTAQ